MTYAQLELIYKANIGMGHQAALDAVYSHGYYDGAGIVPGATSLLIAKTRTAPTTIIKATKPD